MASFILAGPNRHTCISDSAAYEIEKIIWVILSQWMYHSNELSLRHFIQLDQFAYRSISKVVRCTFPAGKVSEEWQWFEIVITEVYIGTKIMTWVESDSYCLFLDSINPDPLPSPPWNSDSGFRVQGCNLWFELESAQLFESICTPLCDMINRVTGNKL